MKRWHWIALGVLTLITLVVEFTILAEHDSHWWDSIPAFYILFGFISCVLIIYVSTWIGKFFLLRDESYYDN